MRLIDKEEVERGLTYEVAIPVVREAMIALSKGRTLQLLRSILTLSEGRMFGVMTGAMGAHEVFGAKLISVFPGNFAKGGQTGGFPSHQGVVVLFEAETGAPVCVVHAGEVTAIRTAAASAVATDALARKDARVLALLGYGEQAGTHARAMMRVRGFERMAVWGRDAGKAKGFAERMVRELGVEVRAVESVRAAVAEADVVCTLTSAAEPILLGEWLRPGTHVNVVGSSHAGPAEVDGELVRRSRFVVDSRASVLAAGAEFLRAKAAGLVGDEHLAAEIGEVLAGDVAGRRTEEEVTVYKSLGHVVQDLACAWVLYAGASAGAEG